MKIGDLHTLKIKADRAIGNQERGSSFQELMKKSGFSKIEKVFNDRNEGQMPFILWK